MIKTTKKHFDYFRERVKYWVEYLGLSGWRLDFTWEELHDCYARFDYNYTGRVAVFRFCRLWEPVAIPLNKEQIDRRARHEVLHLLTTTMYIMTISRYVTESEVDQASEELVRRIEQLMDKL